MTTSSTIRIYDTLTGKKLQFEPIAPPEVKMYVCGLTPYDQPHLGHAVAMLRFNTIRSYLEYRGFKVIFVENVTDIDDKIINKSIKSGEDPFEIGRRYTTEFFELMDEMGELPPTSIPKVTEYIPQIVSFIQQLIERGFAYATPSGNVYFDISKKKDYGKLSNQKLSELLEGVRKDVADEKRNPLDFALWKRDESTKLSAPSPWGIGRPGWHIECSAMIASCLGPSIDIHGGGMDLKFPHHENEIAQSEGCHGVQLAKYWAHCGLLAINGEKMSKSLGNFITFRDALSQYGSDLIRFVVLRQHYRSTIDFSDKLFLDNLNTLISFYRLLDRAAELTGQAPGPSHNPTLPEAHNIVSEFESAMDDDFNSPLALVALQKGFDNLRQEILSSVKSGSISTVETQVKLKELANTLKKLGQVFGLFKFPTAKLISEALNFVAKAKEHPVITPEEIATLLRERNDARSQKNFAAADEIRKKLQTQSIGVLDTPGEGSSWVFSFT